MTQSFHKWLDKYSEQPRGEPINEFDVEMGWNAARDKILQLIEENTDYGYYEAPGGRVGFDTKFIDWKSLIKLKEEIEKL